MGIYQKCDGLRGKYFEGCYPREHKILFIDDVSCSKVDDIQSELLLLANHEPHRVNAKYRKGFLTLFDFIIMCSNRTMS